MENSWVGTLGVGIKGDSGQTEYGLCGWSESTVSRVSSSSL